MKHTLQQRINKAISTPDYLRILILRTVGNFLIIISLFTVVKTFYEPIKSEVRYQADQLVQKEYVIAETTGGAVIIEDGTNQSLPTLGGGKKVERIIPEDTQFGIVIPKIAANARILSDINAGDQEEYQEALRNGVAHAAGTAVPGGGGHIFLFAHSTDYWWNVGQYNAIFYLLYKLEDGDEVTIFYNGKRYKYTVIGQQVVNPNEIGYLTRTTESEFLTLQTCWPPGTTLQRLLVFAVPSAAL